MDSFWDNMNMWLYGIASALFAGCVFLVRKVFTADKKIALLEQQLVNIVDDVKEMKDDVKLLIRRNTRVDDDS